MQGGGRAVRHGAAVIDLAVSECTVCHSDRFHVVAYLNDNRRRGEGVMVCRPCLLEAVKLIDEDAGEHNRVLMKTVQP